MANPVVYPYSSFQADAFGADSNHPITALDPMAEGTSNDAAGWVRRLESEMRRRSSANAGWEEWLGINAPYSPSPNAPAYISGSSFSLTGDWTSASVGNYGPIAVVGRRVKAYTNSAQAPVGLQGTILTAAFAAGITTVTVLWDSGGAIDSSISEVQFGIPAPGQS